MVGIRRELVGCRVVENQCASRHVDNDRSLGAAPRAALPASLAGPGCALAAAPALLFLLLVSEHSLLLLPITSMIGVSSWSYYIVSHHERLLLLLSLLVRRSSSHDFFPCSRPLVKQGKLALFNNHGDDDTAALHTVLLQPVDRPPFSPPASSSTTRRPHALRLTRSDRPPNNNA